MCGIIDMVAEPGRVRLAEDTELVAEWQKDTLRLLGEQVAAAIASGKKSTRLRHTKGGWQRASPRAAAARARKRSEEWHHLVLRH